MSETQEAKAPADGRKFDQGKDRWDLLPWKLMRGVVKVLTFGAVKYADNNWQLVKPKDRYFAAMMRHLDDYRDGETHDSGEGGSGLHHLYHFLCNAMFYAWHCLDEEGENV